MDVVLAAGALVTDDAGRVLLVKRGREPGRGLWSIPGGKAESDETLAMAAARETLEETGLRVVIGRRLWCVRVPTGDGRMFEIHDFAAVAIGGSAVAGDDADEVGWFGPGELSSLPLTPNLLDYLRQAGVGPATQAGATGPVSSGSDGSSAHSSSDPS